MKQILWSLALILTFSGCWGTLFDNPSENPVKDSLDKLDADIGNHLSLLGGRIVEPDTILDSILLLNDIDTSSVSRYFKYGSTRLISLRLDSTKRQVIIPEIVGTVSWAWVGFSGQSIDSIIGFDNFNTAFRVGLADLHLRSIPSEVFDFPTLMVLGVSGNPIATMPQDVIQMLNRMSRTMSSFSIDRVGLTTLPQDWQHLDPEIYFSAYGNSICNLSAAELDALRSRSDQFNVKNQYCNGDTVDILAP